MKGRENTQRRLRWLAYYFLICLATGCDLFVTLAYDDYLGEWDFGDGILVGNSIGPVHLSILGDEVSARLDLSWDDSNVFYMGDRNVSGKKFMGIFVRSSIAPNTIIPRR